MQKEVPPLGAATGDLATSTDTRRPLPVLFILAFTVESFQNPTIFQQLWKRCCMDTDLERFHVIITCNNCNNILELSPWTLSPLRGWFRLLPSFYQWEKPGLRKFGQWPKLVNVDPWFETEWSGIWACPLTHPLWAGELISLGSVETFGSYPRHRPSSPCFVSVD